MRRKTGTTTIQHLLDDERIRKTLVGDRTYYAAIDVVALLSNSGDAVQEWEDIKHFEPSLQSRCVQIELASAEGPEDVLSLWGVMRLIQSIDSPKAERLRKWMAAVAAQHVEEKADPELAIQRMRQSYRAKGYSRQWIDQRLRAISARREVVREWHQRGIENSEQYRALTNKLTQATFGMDVNAYLQDKKAGGHLRDHLSDLELSLLSIAETTAAALHRQRQSQGIEQILRDVEDAGRIISQTRQEISRMIQALPRQSDQTKIVAA
jgi:hypothetical protein